MKRICVALLSLVVTCVLFIPATSQAQSEDQIKSAFLLNFARYVEWSDSAFDSPTAPIRICTLESDSFASVIEATVAGKQVGNRGLTTTPLATADLAAASTSCHILFVGSSDSAAAEAALNVVGSASIFTIANDEGFARRGGIANFFRSGKKIRFEINPNAASKAGLKISSRLLRLARIVE